MKQCTKCKYCRPDIESEPTVRCPKCGGEYQYIAINLSDSRTVIPPAAKRQVTATPIQGITAPAQVSATRPEVVEYKDATPSEGEGMGEELKDIELEIARTRLRREQVALANEEARQAGKPSQSNGQKVWVKWSTLGSWGIGGLALVFFNSYFRMSLIAEIGALMVALALVGFAGKIVCRILFGPYEQRSTGTQVVKAAAVARAEPEVPVSTTKVKRSGWAAAKAGFAEGVREGKAFSAKPKQGK